MRTFFMFILYVMVMGYMAVEVFLDLHGDYYTREVPTVVEVSPESLHELPVYGYGTPEIECLAQNIYHEARDQSIDGMVAVAAVTINRVNSAKYPDSICEVVTQPYQFSWVHQGKALELHNSIERKAWEVSKSIAVMVMNQGVPDDMLGVLYYHADYIKPEWASRKVHRKTIEKHIFYAAL